MMTSHQFIQQNKHKPLVEIALLLSKKPDLDKEFILHQVNGIQKAKKKLPEFYNNSEIVYPSILSMEQCSSEQTAIYKSTLIKGKSLIDLTGGFGVDSFYFSKKFDAVTYLEPNTSLFNIASTNFKLLKARNIQPVNTFAENFLKESSQKIDAIYIDPSRRDDAKRVFNLKDCVPNIIHLSDTIFKLSHQILIKTSPFLDIKQSIKELKYVTRVFVVSVDNECKEVLYLLENRNNEPIDIHTANLSRVNQYFDFNLADESRVSSEYSAPKDYIYEPNASILKAGAFHSIGNKYQINKIATNSHLYTSSKLIQDFPGRIFKVNDVVNYSLNEFKVLGIKQANITCRNFREKPEEIKKKLQLKDGGIHYLFATTDNNNKPILISCTKE